MVTKLGLQLVEPCVPTLGCLDMVLLGGKQACEDAPAKGAGGPTWRIVKPRRVTQRPCRTAHESKPSGDLGSAPLVYGWQLTALPFAARSGESDGSGLGASHRHTGCV